MKSDDKDTHGSSSKNGNVLPHQTSWQRQQHKHESSISRKPEKRLSLKRFREKVIKVIKYNMRIDRFLEEDVLNVLMKLCLKGVGKNFFLRGKYLHNYTQLHTEKNQDGNEEDECFKDAFLKTLFDSCIVRASMHILSSFTLKSVQACGSLTGLETAVMTHCGESHLEGVTTFLSLLIGLMLSHANQLEREAMTSATLDETGREQSQHDISKFCVQLLKSVIEGPYFVFMTKEVLGNSCNRIPFDEKTDGSSNVNLLKELNTLLLCYCELCDYIFAILKKRNFQVTNSLRYVKNVLIIFLSLWLMLYLLCRL